MISVAIFFFAIFFNSAAGAQTAPFPSPTPTTPSRAMTVPVGMIHKEVKGIEMQNLAAPGANKNLKWQKIITGQEPIDGAALIGLPKNSLWQRLGFQNGDVIVRIQGKTLHSKEDLDRALSDLSQEQKQTIDFKIIRGNQQMILNYQLQW